MFNIFNLLDEKPVVYNYRVFLSSGSTIDVRGCKDLSLTVSEETGKITSYHFDFHDTCSFRYIDPLAIVAIMKI